MLNDQEYDVAIIGGGLAGLACAIQLQRAGHSVIVLEKETYPVHKVCGEYISMESWPFLESLGLPLPSMNLPRIQNLLITAPNGNAFRTRLPLGGFGISRFLLDQQLAQLAVDTGVQLLTETKVDGVSFSGIFRLDLSSRHRQLKQVRARVCCAAFGKKSNLDIKWKRSYLNAVDKKLDNFIGIKYHLEGSWDPDLIGLHNFEDGYCGLSRVEDGRYCLCYMTTAASLKRCGNDIRRLEAEVLSVNPHLQKIFSTARIVEGFPITISQINFNSKEPVKDHVLMLGDAAGMITPLCGNGMSIAFHTSKLAFAAIHPFLQGTARRDGMEASYQHAWQQHFSNRLKTGRRLQRFFGSKTLSNAFVSLFKTFPFLAKPVIRMTHGKPF